MSEEARCDALVAQVYGKGAVVQFGRRGRRTTGTKGVPDRAYFVQNTLLWWEVKSGRDRLSNEQRSFLLRVLDGLGWAACGNRDELSELLQDGLTHTACRALIEKWTR